MSWKKCLRTAFQTSDEDWYHMARCIYMTLYIHVYLTESRIVQESAILTGKVTDSETLVSLTVFYLDVGFTDLNFT